MSIKPLIFCLGILPAVALADDFYISSQAGNHLSLFNSKTDEITKAVEVTSGPVMVAVDKSNDVIYLSHPEQGKLSVIDLNSFELINEIKTGGQPFAMILDSQKSQLL